MAELSGVQQHPDDGLNFGELLGELPSSTAPNTAAASAPESQQPMHQGHDDGSDLQDVRSTSKDPMPEGLAAAFAAMYTAQQQKPIGKSPAGLSPTPHPDDAASQQHAAANSHTAPSANPKAPSESAGTSPRKSGAELLPKLSLQPDTAVPTLVESPAAAEDELEQLQLGSASDGETELHDPRAAAPQRSASNVIRAAAEAERSAAASGRSIIDLSDSEQQEDSTDPFRPGVTIHGFGSTTIFGTATSGEAYGDAEEDGTEMDSWPAARAGPRAAAAQQEDGEEMASWPAARAAAGAHAAGAHAAARQAEGEEMELQDFISARPAAKQAAARSSPQPSPQPALAAASEPPQRQHQHQQHAPPAAAPYTIARISPPPRAAAPVSASAAAAGDLLQGQPPSWRDHSRHYLILNSAGRPIWSLHGDEQAQAGITALIQALVSVAQAQGDSLRSITAGTTKLVLLVRGPIYLVAASRCGEPAAALQRQLHLLHSQLLFIVSSSVERALERNPGFDVQALLGSGSETLRRLVSEPLARSPGYLLQALEPLAMAPVDRRAAAEGLQEAVRASGALYGALLVGSSLIALGNAPDLPQLHPLDLLLLATFVESTHSLRVGECFTPICLPHWQPKGIVHTYFKYLSAEPGLCLVLCGNGPDSFFGLSEARAVLETRLHDAGVLQRLRDSWAQRGQGRLLLEALPKPAGGGYGCTPLLHFVFKYPGRRQFVMPAFGEAHTSRQQQQELMASYSQLYCAMHAAGDLLLADQQHGGGPGLPLLQLPRPQRMHWLATEQQVMVAYVDREYEIYAVLDPLADKETATHVCDVLRKHLGSKAKQAELLLLAPSVLSPLQQQLAVP